MVREVTGTMGIRSIFWLGSTLAVHHIGILTARKSAFHIFIFIGKDLVPDGHTLFHTSTFLNLMTLGNSLKTS